jgi:hypothetical protein
MRANTRFLVAAAALMAASCMKAGDGLGLDPSGKPLPFCTVHPDDASCKAVATDPCVLSPASAACSLSLCEKDPTRPGCTAQPDCAKDPSAPGCQTDCAKNPTAPGCTPVDKCTADPTLPECQPKTAFSAVYPILQGNSCLTCHVPGGPGMTQGKLNLASADTAYANLVGVAASVQSVAPGWKRVLASQPDSSILIVKLGAATTTAKMPDGKAYGARMPMGFGALSPEDLAVIRKWIQDGALK